MEGTQHEKIGIVIAAYVIGFTTAFIGFGVNHLKEDSVSAGANYQQGTWNTGQNSDVQKGIMGVTVAEDGLFAITATKERILSADQDVLKASVIESSDLSGYYYQIIDAEASPNGMFVYFCEQLNAEAETCDPYVYSLETDGVYPVKVGEEKYKPTVADHASAWSGESTLTVNTFSSADVLKPWLLANTVQ